MDSIPRAVKIAVCVGGILAAMVLMFNLLIPSQSGIESETNWTDCSFVAWENYNISVVPGAVINRHSRIWKENMTGIAAVCRMGAVEGGLVVVRHLDRDYDPLEYMKTGSLSDNETVSKIVVTDNLSSFCGYPAYAGYADLGNRREYFRIFKPEPYSFGTAESRNIEFFDIVRVAPA